MINMPVIILIAILSVISAIYHPFGPYMFLIIFALTTYAALKDESWTTRIGSAFFLFLAVGTALT